ncbi:lipocalin family protein [Mesonia mobilis]|uniref:lipocalin family protein n=1 Tax=Mesonia mobilis TaxID=369791 RepID=UPI0026F0FF1F|nr:lipocalin family protein [Mesonia mobilis]
MAIEVAVVVFEFNEDGTYASSVTVESETKTVNGTWKLDGTSLSMLLEDSEEWDAAEITLGEGQLVIANEEETLVFKRAE